MNVLREKSEVIMVWLFLCAGVPSPPFGLLVAEAQEDLDVGVAVASVLLFELLVAPPGRVQRRREHQFLVAVDAGRGGEQLELPG